MLNITKEKLQSEVSLRFGTLDSVMTWCRQNCTREWYLRDYTWRTPDKTEDTEFMYIFEFVDEKDFLLFNLRWK